MRQIVFDTETTGMNFNSRDKSEGHRIIELGCVEMLDRQATGNTLHMFFKPDRNVEEEAVGVHGITDQFLADKPTFLEQLEEIESFLAGADELIAHNSDFDCKFLNRELSLAKRNYKIEEKFKIIDTLAIAKKRYPGQRNNLDALCTRLNVNNSNREKHGALLDSEILLEVYLKLTGGQSNLFSTETTEKKSANNVSRSFINTNQHFQWQKVQASVAETKKHQTIMDNLRLS